MHAMHLQHGGGTHIIGIVIVCGAPSAENGPACTWEANSTLPGPWSYVALAQCIHVADALRNRESAGTAAVGGPTALARVMRSGRVRARHGTRRCDGMVATLVLRELHQSMADTTAKAHATDAPSPTVARCRSDAPNIT